MTTQRKVLITGVSGGFGVLIAESLVNAGYKVAGTMRSTSGKNEAVAQQLENIGVHLVAMDVTLEESVNQGIKQAIEALGGLDILANNAGVGALGMMEHFQAEDMQAIFDVNVFGVQRVMRAVLPHFRAQGHGTVIYTSSLLGRMTLPFYGPYNASKWALEAMAENYRTELSALGIESCIVEPGGFPTTFMDNLMQPSDQSRDVPYQDLIARQKGMFEGFEKALENNPEQRPQKVADAMLELVGLPHGEKPFRTVVDYMGMGSHIGPYNNALEKLTEGIYSVFGNDDMLKVK